MLHRALFCLFSALFVPAQSALQLNFNSVTSISPNNLPNPPLFSLPDLPKLSLSIALCSDPASQNSPKFFIVNATGNSEIRLSNGLGVWSGRTAGATLKVDDAQNAQFEIGVSDADPIHQIVTSLPLLGDTTSNQAIIFSPVFSEVPLEEPSFPNYTLPPANLPLPNAPAVAQTPNFTLLLDTTSTTSLLQVPQTGCRLLAAPRPTLNLTQSPWLRGDDGWRMQFFIRGLTPLTNYTAYVIESGSKVSGPIFLVTKSASFSCPLVHSLPYCPGVSYAVPLPAPPAPATDYDASVIPNTITDPLFQYLTNFTTTLTTFACGRDLYSPIITCADCQRAYRKWLCLISFTRCTEPPSSVDPPSNNGRSQVPLRPASTPVPTSQDPRNPNLPRFPTEYTALLPCYETCTAVDRTCPNFLGFRCPVLRFNARDSYGVGVIDSGTDGEQDGGLVGAPVDRWGVAWCNG